MRTFVVGWEESPKAQGVRAAIPRMRGLAVGWADVWPESLRRARGQPKRDRGIGRLAQGALSKASWAAAPSRRPLRSEVRTLVSQETAGIGSFTQTTSIAE